MKKTTGNDLGTTVLILGTLACAAALADEPASTATPTAPTGPSLTDVLAASGITETGYVAASYYHSNGYNTDHQFDNKHDSFQLDQAALTVAYQPKQGFGALVNVAAGEDMKILNAAEGSNPNTFDIVQGFVQYATGPLTVIAGKYVTLAGAEVIAPTGNTNFSRSLLFYAEPLTHTGIRATYAASDTVSVIVGVNNGWNYSSLQTSGCENRGVGNRMDAEQAVLVDGPGLCRQRSHFRCAKNLGRRGRHVQRDCRADLHSELRLGQAGATCGRSSGHEAGTEPPSIRTMRSAINGACRCGSNTWTTRMDSLLQAAFAKH